MKEQKYTLVVNKKGFAFATVNFVLTKYEGEVPEVTIPIEISKAEPGALAQLHYVYYDFNRYVLKEMSYATMNNLLEFMKQHPAVKTEIYSHIDRKGASEYNQALSQKRAQSVMNYLKANGTDSKRRV